jgi:glycosyltransferase involved in cell wall biosynthesis
VAIDLVNELRFTGYESTIVPLRRPFENDDIAKEVETAKGVSRFLFLCIKTLMGGETIVIHSHGLRPDLVSMLLKLACSSKVIWICTLHDDVREYLRLTYGMLGRAVAPIWLTMVKRSDGTVFLNEFLLNKYRKNFRTSRLQSIENGRIKRDFEPEKRGDALAGETKLRVGFLGMLTVRKQVVPLAEVLRAFPAVEFVVAGKGPMLGRLKEIYSDNSNFIYLGFIKDLSAFFAQVDVLVLPSISEGFPLVIPEALAHGVPCILSRLDQYSSLDGQEGLFFVDEISGRAIEPIFDALCANYASISRAARRTWMNRLTLDRMVNRYSNFYRSVIGDLKAREYKQSHR